MFITHILLPSLNPGMFLALQFLCQAKLDDPVFRCGFQTKVVLTPEEVRMREASGSIAALAQPERVDSEDRIPWLDELGHVWLLSRTAPREDPLPKYLGLLHH